MQSWLGAVLVDPGPDRGQGVPGDGGVRPGVGTEVGAEGSGEPWRPRGRGGAPARRGSQGLLAGGPGGDRVPGQPGRRLRRCGPGARARAAPSAKSDLVADYRDAIGIGVVALGITLATLVLGEFVPRRLAMHRPESIAGLVARPIRVLATLANPVVGALSAATDFALRGVGIRPSPEIPVTEEEIRVLMQEGTKAGVFEEGEHEMVKRVLRFGDRRARALMTPRNEIVWIDLADSPEEVRRKVIASPHSRFPVCDQSLDNLLGIVHVKDLLGQGQNVEPFRIKGRLTLPLFLYEGTHGLKILEMFKTSGTHSAVVLDEYGTVEGLLTLTDILAGDRRRHAREHRGRGAPGGPAARWVLAPRRPVAARRISRPVRPAGHPRRRLPYPGRPRRRPARPYSPGRRKLR